jgi:predicted nucleic acid-binding protein
MNGPLLLDTTVLIDHLRYQPEATALLARLPSETLVSAATVLELFAGARRERERRSLDRLVATFEVVPVTRELAREAGLLKQAHPTRLADPMDAIIAATAVARSATLLTSNIRHFTMLERVREPYSILPS